MEVMWTWMCVLGPLMFVEISWTRAIDEDQKLVPEDVELAEVCEQMTALQRGKGTCKLDLSSITNVV